MQMQYRYSVCAVLGIAFVISFYLLVAWFKHRSVGWMPSLKGKHVVVTGGSKGIGLALAMRALREGAFVTLISRSSAGLEKVVQDIIRGGGYGPHQICAKPADVGDQEAICKAIGECFQWKPIDILICNAGVAIGGYADEMPINDANFVTRTNVMGTFYTIRAALPLMKQHAGHGFPTSVVLLGSMASLVRVVNEIYKLIILMKWENMMFFMTQHPVYGHAIYTATKHAVKGMAECLRLELLPHNIRVTLSCPGFADTHMVHNAARIVDKNILDIIKVVDLYDPNRMEDPVEIAKVTMEGVKRGSFLVVTDKYKGLLLSTFSRGLFPAESFGRSIAETIVFGLCRLGTHAFAAIVRRAIGSKTSS